MSSKNGKIDGDLLGKYSQVFTVASAATKAADVFRHRRQIQRQSLDSITLFAGINGEPGSENIWWMNGVRVIQEPAILWLSGINQTQTVILLDPEQDDGSGDILFLPGKKSEKEFWDGVRLGLYPINHPEFQDNLCEIKILTGFAQVKLIEDLQKALVELLVQRQSKCQVFCHYYPANDQHKLKKITTDHNWNFYLQVKTWARKNKWIVNPMALAHLKHRLILDKYQVKDAEQATSITYEAFTQLMQTWGQNQTENQLSRHLEYFLLRDNPWGLAFPTICANEKNACTLHYLKNDSPLKKGSLVLLDFGARFGSQHADISRTLPISGQFNPLQKILYQIVLDAQKYNEAYLKPGVNLNDANQRVWSFIEESLKTRFIALGGKMKRCYDFKPHGVSHLMGEQEHEGDPFRLYASKPLEVGMLLSNEPGLYGYFEIQLEGKRYAEWIGIRIEDNLLITKNGNRNLSFAIPKEILHLEQILQGALHA